MSTSSVKTTLSNLNTNHYEVGVTHPSLPNQSFTAKFRNPSTVLPGFANAAAYQAACQAASTALVDACATNILAGRQDATLHLMGRVN